jgi:hypothetical protein
MTDYDGWGRNCADSYTLALAEIAKHGWRCPAMAPAKCVVPECARAGTCRRGGQKIHLWGGVKWPGH